MENKKVIEILEERFSVNKISENNYELESFTDGGVNMFIHIDTDDESMLEGFKRYIKDFDVEEQVEFHRHDKQYCNHFTLRESLDDFEEWENDLKLLLEKIEKNIMKDGN